MKLDEDQKMLISAYRQFFSMLGGLDPVRLLESDNLNAYPSGVEGLYRSRAGGQFDMLSALTNAGLLDGSRDPFPVYKDSTPELHVGESAFEKWYESKEYDSQVSIKQMCRDSYAAGMGDPLVTYAKQTRQVTDEMVEAYLAFADQGSYLNHPDVPYFGTAYGDSEEKWKRRLIKAVLVAVIGGKE